MSHYSGISVGLGDNFYQLYTRARRIHLLKMQFLKAWHQQCITCCASWLSFLSFAMTPINNANHIFNTLHSSILSQPQRHVLLPRPSTTRNNSLPWRVQFRSACQNWIDGIRSRACLSLRPSRATSSRSR